MKAFMIAAVLGALSTGLALQAQMTEPPIPSLVQQDGRYALMVDGAPYLMLGAQATNSSNWPSTLPKVWPAIEYLHANTLEIPVYWEQFEPQEGQFDYTGVDTILAQAREHHVHLVLLWFGTWKNGSQHFMPEWMKLDPQRYTHVMNKEGEYIDSPSPFATASLEADKRAFAAFMQYLKEVDTERTVLLVQVENETGAYGSIRDYSPEANKLFDGPVPPEVVKAMGKTAAPGANWETVFGPEAEVYFHAWAVSKYVGQVAAAGKAAYPLPLYVNAALRDPLKPEVPVNYESGGPTDNVIPIWKAEAPAIDIEAPDDYITDPAGYMKVLDLYRRPDNALFVPETIPFSPETRWFFSVLGHEAIGYAPFGLDYIQPHRGENGQPESQEDYMEPTAQNYRLIEPMMRDIARLNFEGKLQATAEEAGETTQILHFGAWDAVVSYAPGRRMTPNENQTHETLGRALVAQLGDNQFLVAGYYCHVDFQPAGVWEQFMARQAAGGAGPASTATPAGKRLHRQFLRVEEGTYENGAFKFLRILNGDQLGNGAGFTSDPEVVRVSLATY